MSCLMSVPTLPTFVPCAAGRAQGLEKAVNIRVGMDGGREVYQVVGGAWTDVSDAVLPPTLCEELPCNVSVYFEYAYSKQDASYY